ncbi:SDR family oxidoreductase [Cohnella cholangitidis]|uniref:NAD-dependent epimerase/dehydratase family protein n=1 Tax=Cohnella cholangitidis TaxID=2598458 RepID=A0A7G5BXM8_9BACL|nr:NAD-dependent epimerase/dehydratase family protein [Cohnella cholangitidis]QMV41712.1 NAD-dependent epimerase/dehydratase family protein [Cohnella cholangitidis]
MILVTGATGFTGSHFMKKLMETDKEIRCFVRPTSDTNRLDRNRIETVSGTLEDKDSYRKALQGVDTLINIASLGFGHADTIVNEAVNAGVRRAIFVSTTAIFTTLAAQTKAIRLAAESKVTGSSLDYTILRPTMIYGTERDRNMSKLIRVLHRYPVMPIAGDGQSLQQPIYVDDLADAIMGCMSNPECSGKAYNLSGKEPLTFDQVIDITANALNKKVKKLHVPLRLILPVVGLYNRVAKNPKIKIEQVLRLNENKSFDHAAAKKDFGFSPISFAEGIKLEVERIRKLKLI